PAPAGPAAINEFVFPGYQAASITAGSDGALWLGGTAANASRTGALVRITLDGNASVALLAGPTNDATGAIITGSDGNLYVTEGVPDTASANDPNPVPGIGVLNPQSGTSGFYNAPLYDGRYNASNGAGSIAAGADGSVWFAAYYPPELLNISPGFDSDSLGIGRITPTGQVTYFSTGSTAVDALAPGSNGDVWFVWGAISRGIGHIAADGTIKYFNL